MRVAHLFAGIGGGLLADLILGHTPVLAVEQDEYCCQVLEELRNEGWFPELHVHYGDIRKFDFEPWRGRVDQIAAGFPCQDISCANTGGKGIKGERSGLVREVWRAVDAIRPAFVFLENSPNIRTKGRREVIAALVERGYSWRDGTLAASHVGAGHKRNRWWCLAANDDGLRKLEQERCIAEQRGWTCHSAEENANVDEIRWDGRTRAFPTPPGWIEFTDRLERAVELGGLSNLDAEAIAVAGAYTNTFGWSPPDAGVRRVVDGMADRVDRIKALGNAQVPLQAATAWVMLMIRGMKNVNRS